MQAEDMGPAQDAGASTTTGPQGSPGHGLMETAGGTPGPTTYGDNDALKQQKPGPRRGAPLCQVPGCCKDLSGYKGYHQRYKICEEHFRMPSMVLHGQVVRFCQQCGKFQPIDEFTNDRRSCSVQLALHAGRRRRRHALARAKKLEALKHRISGGSGSEDSDFDDDEEEDGSGRYSASARSTRKSSMGAGGGGSSNGLTGLTQQEVRMLRALIKNQKEGDMDPRKQASSELPPGMGVGMAPNSMFQMHTAGSATLPALRGNMSGTGFLGPQDMLLPDGALHGSGALPMGLPGQGMPAAGGFGTTPMLVSSLPAAAAGLQPNTQQQVMMMDWAGMGMPDQTTASMAAQLGPVMPGSGTIMHGNGQTIAPGSGDSLQTRIQGLQGIMTSVPVQSAGSQPTMMLHGAATPGAQGMQQVQLVWGDGKLQLVQQPAGVAAPRLSVSGMTEAGAGNGLAVQKPSGAQAAGAAEAGPKSDSSTVGDTAPAASAPAGMTTDKNEAIGPSSAVSPRPHSGPQQGGVSTPVSAPTAQTPAAAQATVLQQSALAAGIGSGAGGTGSAALLQASMPQAAGGQGMQLPMPASNRMAAQVAMQMQAHMQDLTGAVRPGNPFSFGAAGGGSTMLNAGPGGSLQAVRQLGRVVEVLPAGSAFPGMSQPTQPVSAPVLRNLGNGLQVLQWPPGSGSYASAENVQMQQLSLISGQTTPQLASLPELRAYKPASTGQVALMSQPGMQATHPQTSSLPNLQAFVQQQQVHANNPGSAGHVVGHNPSTTGVLGSATSASCSHAPGDMAVDLPTQTPEGAQGGAPITPAAGAANSFSLSQSQLMGGMPQMGGMLNLQNIQLLQLPMDGVSRSGQTMQLALPNSGNNMAQLMAGSAGMQQQWNLLGQQQAQQQQQLAGMMARQPVSMTGMQGNQPMPSGLQVISADDLQKLLSQGVQITGLRTL